MKVEMNCKCGSMCGPLKEINAEVAFCCYFCPANNVCGKYNICTSLRDGKKLFRTHCRTGDNDNEFICGKIVDINVILLREYARRE